jgi:hypothetical protein
MRHAAGAVLTYWAMLATVAPATVVKSAVLAGTVRDGKGNVVSGVRVQLFLDGFPSEAARSDSLGGYRLEFGWPATADSTVTVWWTANQDWLVPAVAVLRESATARRMGLWEATIPRIAAPAESVHDVVLRSVSEPSPPTPVPVAPHPGPAADAMPIPEPASATDSENPPAGGTGDRGESRPAR